MSDILQEMAAAGAHFGYSKTKRHPSVRPFIFTTKNRGDIIDLEQTQILLEKALEFIKELGEANKQILLVGTKPEGRSAIASAADTLGLPYVTERWIGGALTNFSEIKRRVERLEDLAQKQETDSLVFKTKKEKLMIEREIEKLRKNFEGLIPMKELPVAVLVIDSKKEAIAIAEAQQKNIPVISLSNTDCDIAGINYPVVANDASVASIKYFVNKVVESYKK